GVQHGGGLAVPLRESTGSPRHVVEIPVHEQRSFGPENILHDGDLLGSRRRGGERQADCDTHETADSHRGSFRRGARLGVARGSQAPRTTTRVTSSAPIPWAATARRSSRMWSTNASAVNSDPASLSASSRKRSSP